MGIAGQSAADRGLSSLAGLSEADCICLGPTWRTGQSFLAEHSRDHRR